MVNSAPKDPEQTASVLQIVAGMLEPKDGERRDCHYPVCRCRSGNIEGHGLSLANIFAPRAV